MNKTSDRNIKAIAFYLPQFHPIPENDKWWGKGFTEWTNVKKAKPLFPGHVQPVEPGELGYYDLRDPDVRIKQAKLAKEYGVKGFCYWHYWFGNGKTILERPINEVVETGEPDFPFCMGWANESWTGVWHGNPDHVLIEQTYPGTEDIINHFHYLLPKFEDSRYLKIDNKPFFLVYKPLSHPHIQKFTDLFNELAVKNGFKGIHFVATNIPPQWDLKKHGFNAGVLSYHHRIKWKKKGIIEKFRNFFEKKISFLKDRPEHIYRYKEALKYFVPDFHEKDKYYPTIIPNWDNSPRAGKKAVIFTGSTPGLFEKHVNEAVKFALKNSEEHRIIMIKSWNEWAEGNYLEPDKKWGRTYLEVLKKVLNNNSAI